MPLTYLFSLCNTGDCHHSGYRAVAYHSSYRWLQCLLSSNSGYEVPPTPVSTPPGTVTAGENSLTHPMPTSVPRHPPTHNGMCCNSMHWVVVLHSEHFATIHFPHLAAVSTEMECSTGVSSAGENSHTHLMPTSFPRDTHTHNGMCCNSMHWVVVLHSEHFATTCFT